MKNLISILTCTMIMVVVASAQNVINPASPGFDVIRENIPRKDRYYKLLIKNCRQQEEP
jgi:hypothetical protein